MPGGEIQLVEWLRTRFPTDPARVPVSIGDDAAVLRVTGNLIAVTADMLLDGVHFRRDEHSLELIGRKAIACSLSDCAAMGCRPRAAVVSVALTDSMTLSEVQRLYEGMASIADEFDCPIVGGDTTSWPAPLAIDVAMLAEPMAERGPILRTTARPGDAVFVSGTLGGSLAGKHLTFTPRLELAGRLVRDPDLHAMMDLSDGLSLDLFRLCAASGCAAELHERSLDRVISDAARACAARDGTSPLEHALHDGEDFELLVCGGDALAGRVAELTPIGRITPPGPAGVAILSIREETGSLRPLEPRGYEHLR